MSELESATKPILSPLIGGVSSKLSLTDQLQIAWWTAKTAMVFEAMNSETRVSTDDERELLRLEKRAPATMQLRLACCEESAYSLAHVRIVVASNFDDPQPDAYASTLRVGRLALQVFRPTSPRGFGTFERLGLPQESFIPIQPLSADGITWPPRHKLDDEEFQRFARSTFNFDVPPLPWGQR